MDFVKFLIGAKKALIVALLLLGSAGDISCANVSSYYATENMPSVGMFAVCASALMLCAHNVYKMCNPKRWKHQLDREKFLANIQNKATSTFDLNSMLRKLYADVPNVQLNAKYGPAPTFLARIDRDIDPHAMNTSFGMYQNEQSNELFISSSVRRQKGIIGEIDFTPGDSIIEDNYKKMYFPNTVITILHEDLRSISTGWQAPASKRCSISTEQGRKRYLLTSLTHRNRNL